MYSKQFKVALRDGKMILLGAVGLVALASPALAGQATAPTTTAPSAATSPTEPVPAQPPTGSAVAPPGPITVVPKPTGPIETSPTPAESKMFLDAMKAIRQAPFIKLASTANLTVIHGKQTILVDESLAITGGKNGQFRSEVRAVTTVNGVEPASPPHTDKYTVVSDGKKQIIYQHGNDTYAVSLTTDTKDMSSQLFQGLLYSMKASKDLQFGDFDKFRQQGNLITATSPKVDEIATDKVLHLMSKDGSLQARFILDPTSGHFDKMQLQVSQPGLILVFTEVVTQQSLPDSVDPSLFQFTPPHGAKKVPSIAVGIPTAMKGD